MGYCLSCGANDPSITLLKCGDCKRLEKYMEHQEKMNSLNSMHSYSEYESHGAGYQSSGGFFSFIGNLIKLVVGLAIWAVVIAIALMVIF